ncbi:MAG: hypothetical protein K8T25_15110 [Planctomycetia bacterium]|nr:hypothetical protein [Planctomycetia bacterium]
MVSETELIDAQDEFSLPHGIDPGHGQRAACRYIEPEEFYRLAISSRLLVRCDDRAAGLRGLWDPTERVWYIIEEDRLYTGLRRTAEPLEHVGA